MTRPKLATISPSLIVTNVTDTINFYRDKLDFKVTFQQPDKDPFFAVLQRDGAQLFIKSEGGITPVPNHTRHRHLRLDAFIYTADPDALAAEFSAKGVTFSSPLQGTTDGLRGFELADPDGYTIFFGCPTSEVKPSN